MTSTGGGVTATGAMAAVLERDLEIVGEHWADDSFGAIGSSEEGYSELLQNVGFYLIR